MVTVKVKKNKTNVFVAKVYTFWHISINYIFFNVLFQSLFREMFRKKKKDLKFFINESKWNFPGKSKNAVCFLKC